MGYRPSSEDSEQLRIEAHFEPSVVSIQSKSCTSPQGGFLARLHPVPEREASMKGYGQFCPVAKAAEVFAERWTPLVVRELLAGSTQFNHLHRGVPLMSRTLLSRRLKQLEETGVVKRKSGPRGPEYHLTTAGREFAPMIHCLGEWGQRWFRSKYGPDETDVRLLTWEMRRSVKPEAFPPGRASVEFDFVDQPESKRHWWIVIDGNEADLCPTDPGYEVNLLVQTDLKTLTCIWMGDISIRNALASGKLEIEGSRAYRQCFERWLGCSGFASVKSVKAA
jgi:DNA-binding HxlR family transcriptional regulator